LPTKRMLILHMLSKFPFSNEERKR
jgi:hypothetical protein